jgi:hypothetical protein
MHAYIIRDPELEQMLPTNHLPSNQLPCLQDMPTSFAKVRTPPGASLARNQYADQPSSTTST